MPIHVRWTHVGHGKTLERSWEGGMEWNVPDRSQASITREVPPSVPPRRVRGTVFISGDASVTMPDLPDLDEHKRTCI